VREGNKSKQNVTRYRPEKSEVVACDLFAGAGGFSLGAHLAGIRIAAAIEWDNMRARLIDPI
jgi:DNA (cytosine-5)-methyltransferase 1